jgi:UPF0176 protein
MTQIQNIAGYKFISLASLDTLRAELHALCAQEGLKGTILLSSEGINITLAGPVTNMSVLKSFLQNDSRFADITFHVTYSDAQPFRFLKVKIKKEIITLRKPEANPVCARAPSIAPEILKQWLDEKRDITLLDTRNDFEVRLGTFTGAVNPQIGNFGEIPVVLEALPKTKPVVMFCTGGIRCEKAALYMLNHGFAEVYQLDGGILGYFAKVGGVHYEGECFVFDERISVRPEIMKLSP